MAIPLAAMLSAQYGIYFFEVSRIGGLLSNQLQASAYATMAAGIQ